MQLLQEIQRSIEKYKFQPEQVKDRIIVMSMYNDTNWKKQETKRFVCRILQMLLRTPEDLLKDIGHFPGRDRKKMVRNAHSHTKRLVE